MNPLALKKLENYDHFHKNFVNKVIHYVGIPLILYSTIALLSLLGRGHLNFAVVTIIAVSIYYWLSMGRTMSLAFVFFATLFYFVGRSVPLSYNVGIFVFGWVTQILGHRIYEKNSPAFFKNFEQLLMGPAWFFTKVLHFK